jgi:hypothetical protein
VEIGQTLWQLVIDLGTLGVELLALALRWGVVLGWLAWWLRGVNWKKLWPVLAQGAWLPLLLLMVLAAMTWSRLDPVACNCLGFMTLPNFWWQFLGVSLLIALTLMCGWLQGLFGWEPAEINLEPPVAAAHEHGHADD